MNIMESLFVWAGGYSPRILANESEGDREPVAKLGGAVMLAAAVAAANWGIAAHEYASGFPEQARLVMTIAAGLAGIAIVLVIDRTSLFFFDTMHQSAAVLALWSCLRLGLVLCVSSLTAQVIVPIWLHSELQVHALQMQEASDAWRQARLTERFKVNEKQDKVAAAAKELSQLKEQSKNIPAEVERQFENARRCWDGYRARRNQMILQSGMSDGYARSQLASLAKSCARRERGADEARKAYNNKMRRIIGEANKKEGAADAEFRTATAAVAARLKQARAIEQRGLNAQSATVLSSLLKSDPGARVKLGILVVFLTTVELLPLITKLLAGKSAVGFRISVDRALQRMVQQERMAVAKHDTAVAGAIGSAMQGAMATACGSAEIRRFCIDLFGIKLKAFVPFEVAQEMLRKIESTQLDVNGAMRNFPRCAGAISEVWSQALREAVDLLKTASEDRRTDLAGVDDDTREGPGYRNRAA